MRKNQTTIFNRTVNRGAKAIRIAAPIIKKLTPAERKRLVTLPTSGPLLVIVIYPSLMCHKLAVNQC
ncbi:LtrC-like protein [Lactiplantibacillus plantarum WJL]|uniref:LtrC-like protein n=2 Tax=Lactiplantibacillus plantarum TaxID=1590 RepID=A0AAW3RMU4_LACPN|nr:LtrC-like protein [Lactiplantibacillus plantarum WJL]KZV06404.1 LtrC-like protein [Lactiplantibacillus plantarum]